MVLLVRMSKSSSHGIPQGQTMPQCLHQGFARGLRFESKEGPVWGENAAEELRQQELYQETKKPLCSCSQDRTAHQQIWLQTEILASPEANGKHPTGFNGSRLNARSRASHSSAVAMRASFPSKAVSAARASRRGEWLSLQPEKYQWEMKDSFLTEMVTVLEKNLIRIMGLSGAISFSLKNSF